MNAGKVLTALVAILGVALVGSLIYANYFAALGAYSGNIQHSIARLAASYDYSCGEPVYGIHVAISNNGTKSVTNLSVSVSNPLCKGALPILSNVLTPRQGIEFYVYSSEPNGTVTVSGNNTLVLINF